MARTIQQIQNAILVDVANRPELAELNSTSAVAIYRLMAYVVAAAIATLENLFDVHVLELRDEFARQMPHTLRYYQEKALAFREGRDLIPGTTVYAEDGTVDVEALRVVQYASVREAGDTVSVKVAGAELEALTAPQLVAFRDYMNEVKDAGVRMEVSSGQADRLRVELDIYFNPQIIDGQGRRFDGTDDQVVRNAIVRYTENLRFDGQFVTASMVDELQRTEGIQIPNVRSVRIARSGDPQFVTVNAIYEPAAGFVRLYSDEDLIVNYIPYADA